MYGAKTSPCVFMLILMFVPNDAGGGCMSWFAGWFLKGERMGPICVRREKQAVLSVLISSESLIFFLEDE